MNTSVNKANIAGLVPVLGGIAAAFGVPVPQEALFGAVAVFSWLFTYLIPNRT